MDKKVLKDLPRTPGVYLFKDNKDKVIYIGKAKDIKSRVSTYFQKGLNLGAKTRSMVKKINEIETIKTESELEALVLEAELIRRHKPRYNIVHKDDKSHLYIVIRSEKLEVEEDRFLIPKVITSRKTDLKKDDIKFGPYPSAGTARLIIRNLRKAFPYRDCSASKFNRYNKLGRPCLYGHLDLCSAPCQPENSLEEYKKEIERIKNFLSGKSSQVINEYENKMKTASENKDYERAAHYRDMIKKFNYIRANFKTADKYIENPNLVEDLAQEALKDLQEGIEILHEKPNRIECYDISNISGKEAVGSMVVSTDGMIDKGEYRKFKIKLKEEPDDVNMMKEVLSRRLKRAGKDQDKESKDFWDLPDLILLDGGKGQVSAVLEVVQEKNIDIPVVGIAKKKETLVYKHKNKFKELNLDEDNEGLKLVIRLRDEAHRFAQRYHHHLRLKNFKV